MFRKGLCRARSLCMVQHELESAFTLQRQQCRLKNTATNMKPKASRKKIASKKKVDGEPVKKFTSLTPKYSIYITDEYPPQKFSFEKCIEMHKEAAAPEMTNTLHAQVYADIELDCTTNKKTKFMKNIRGLLEFPHKFEHKQKKDIFIFSENPTDWEQCKELGATTVGGDELIGYLNQGLLRPDDIEKCDFLFATPAMALKLLKMRSILMDKTPTLQNGCIVSDFEPIIKKHIEGVTFKSHKKENSVGLVQVPFGQLYQEANQLKENFDHMVSVLAALKPKNQAYLLKTIRLIAPPSTEIFELEFIKTEGVQTQEIEDSDDED